MQGDYCNSAMYTLRQRFLKVSEHFRADGRALFGGSLQLVTEKAGRRRHNMQSLLICR